MNACRECNGKGKPSKGIMNYHNIQIQNKSKEFETVMENCIKCEDCGHSWIKGKLISNESRGCYSEQEINNFEHQDCDDYLNSHTRKELNSMTLKEKTTLILELEFNFQNQ